MKSIVLRQTAKTGSISHYLHYFFLRFPGSLGAETRIHAEIYDSYDLQLARSGFSLARLDDRVGYLPMPDFLQFQEIGNSETALAGTSGNQAIPGLHERFGLWAIILLWKGFLTQRVITFQNAPEIQARLVGLRSEKFLILDTDQPLARQVVKILLAEGFVEIDGNWQREFLSGAAKKAFPPIFRPGALVPEQPAAPLVSAMAIFFLTAAQYYEEGVIDDHDTECLHQYRVNLRRCRSLVSLTGLLYPPETLATIKQILGDFQRRTNELRDLDVQLLGFSSLMERLPWETGVKLAALATERDSLRKKAQRMVKVWFRSPEYVTAKLTVTSLLEMFAQTREDPDQTLKSVVETILNKTAHKLVRTARQLQLESGDERLHKLRILAKKLRYTLDFFAPIFPATAVKDVLGTLKVVQEQLGNFQDLCVQIEQFYDRAHNPRGLDPFSLGVLMGSLSRDHAAAKQLALRGSRSLSTRQFRLALKRMQDSLNPNGGTTGVTGN